MTTSSTQLHRYGIPQPIWQQIGHVGSKTLTTTTKLGVIRLTESQQSHYGIQTIKMGFTHFLPRHFKKYGVLCYTLHSKNAFECPSVSLSVCPSVRPSVRPSVHRFHSSNLLWEMILGRSVLGLQMGKFGKKVQSYGHWLTLEIGFHSLSLAFLYRFSSNLIWESILWRSVLGLQKDKFRQISTELWPLIDVINWFFTLYLWLSLPIFFKLCIKMIYFALKISRVRVCCMLAALL